MSKRLSRRQTARALSAATPAIGGEVQAFSFGDPEPVLSRATMLDMIECWHNGRWYEPPISLDGLSRAFRASPHHSSAIMLKRNMLAASLEPTPWLSRKVFAGMVLDYLVLGNAYAQEIRNRFGDLLRLDHPLAKYTRRGVEPGAFWWVPGLKNEEQFPLGAVHQLLAPDLNQEIYGVPEYISALQSALLNENATLFRRRYYENGSHAGYIMYATGEFAEGDVDAMRSALKKSRGPGNFRNLFVHSPNGKENGIKLLPIAQMGASDEFLGIKNTTRDDVLAAHRVPPQLLGIVPANAGGFGDVTKATDAFFELELAPLQSVFLDLNEAVGTEVVRFRPRDM
ncbi:MULTISPECIES: phage portal protein [unclassified Sphingobium]|uniref:phage portal protein n=1 Tax=unclassified Sphingobium TaxID=2611147 RepID=UPI00222501D6|nr:MULTISPECIES: phage portal protein [unclassified Sphingobium]MCW2410890.1 PBSX family phage portal protein [Sphingobium sp. B8D3D]MCW2416820.1 PBSX family phage portal protein [Sphingobium sp. B8D3A]